eukprot:tig00020848_g14556.t1
MSDDGSDDELIGTPFQEEPTDRDALSNRQRQKLDEANLKFRPVWQQTVTDEEGRRRFHGAFTGGFSAGYYNTVGTKEGWAPSTFVSSRAKKTERKESRPEDFMDDEDRAALGLGPSLRTKEDYDILSRGASSAETRKPSPDEATSTGSSAVPRFVPDSLIIPARDSIGTKLLRAMGWREGQGIGPKRAKKRQKTTKERAGEYNSDKALIDTLRNQSSTLNEGEVVAVDLDDVVDSEEGSQLVAPTDVSSYEAKPKTDFYGLGFDPLASVPELSKLRELKQAASAKEKDKSSRISFSGAQQGGYANIGLGAFETADDYEVYGGDDMANYDIDLGPRKAAEKRLALPAASTSNKESSFVNSRCMDGSVPLKGYVLVSEQQESTKWWPPPQVPTSFTGKHIFTAPPLPVIKRPESGKPTVVLNMSSDLRGRILGELPLPSKESLISDAGMGLDSTQMENLRKALATASTRLQGNAALKPFRDDEEKQARYDKFLQEIADGKQPYVMGAKGMTEFERQREQEDFVKAALFFSRPMADIMASRFTSSGETLSASGKVEVLATPQSTAPKAAISIGQRNRTEEDWHPDRLLCKRFNLRDPWEGRAGPAAPKPKATVYDVVPELPFAGARGPEGGGGGAAPEERRKKDPKNRSDSDDEDDIGLGMDSAVVLEARPEIDVFEAIFNFDAQEEPPGDAAPEAPAGASEEAEAKAQHGSAVDAPPEQPQPPPQEAAEPSQQQPPERPPEPGRILFVPRSGRARAQAGSKSEPLEASGASAAQPASVAEAKSSAALHQASEGCGPVRPEAAESASSSRGEAAAAATADRAAGKSGDEAAERLKPQARARSPEKASVPAPRASTSAPSAPTSDSPAAPAGASERAAAKVSAPAAEGPAEEIQRRKAGKQGEPGEKDAEKHMRRLKEKEKEEKEKGKEKRKKRRSRSRSRSRSRERKRDKKEKKKHKKKSKKKKRRGGSGSSSSSSGSGSEDEEFLKRKLYEKLGVLLPGAGAAAAAAAPARAAAPPARPPPPASSSERGPPPSGQQHRARASDFM